MIRKVALFFACLLAALAQPALAASFDFSTTTNPAVKDPGLFSATFGADGSGGLFATSGTYKGSAVTFSQFFGAYDTATKALSTLVLKFSYNNAVYTMTLLDDQSVSTYSKVGTSTSLGGTSLYTATPTGFASVPEIDGSKLPITLFILGTLVLWLQTRRRAVSGAATGFVPAAA